MQVVPFNFGGGAGKNKRALVEKLMVVLEQRLITFPKELDILLEELRAFTYETTDFGNIRYTAPDGLHDDCVMSLALAVFGLGSYVYAPMNRPQMVNRPRLQMADNI
jgi:hypothetical protein